MKPIALKLREDAKIPTKRQADAGYDLYAVWDEPVVLHKPHEVMIFPTGLKMRFPNTHVATVKERGSTGIRNMQVRAGIIEGNYAGEYKVLLTNGNDGEDILYVKDNWTFEDVLKVLRREYPYYGWDGLAMERIGVSKDELGREYLFDKKYKSLTLSPSKFYLYPQSKAIAQMVITKKEDWEFEEVSEEEFNSIETDRGEGWNGSTGK